MSRRNIPYPFAPVPAISWQPDGRRLDTNERLVLAAFVDRWVQGHDVIAIGAAELARVTGLSERTTDVARQRLLDRGLVVRLSDGGGRQRNGTGRAAEYRLGDAVAKGAARARLRRDERGNACPVQGGSGTPGNGAPAAWGSEESEHTRNAGSAPSAAAPARDVPSEATAALLQPVKTWD